MPSYTHQQEQESEDKDLADELIAAENNEFRAREVSCDAKECGGDSDGIKDLPGEGEGDECGSI